MSHTRVDFISILKFYAVGKILYEKKYCFWANIQKIWKYFYLNIFICRNHMKSLRFADCLVNWLILTA